MVDTSLAEPVGQKFYKQLQQWSVIGFLIGAFSFGYSFGITRKDNILAIEREKYDALHDKHNDTKEQLSQVKLEYTLYRFETMGNTAAAGRGSAGKAGTESDVSQDNVEEVTIHAHKAGVLFEDTLFISLKNIQYTPNGDSKYLVNATISTTGGKALEIDKKPVGFATTYHGFEVRILQVDMVSVKFRVERLQQ